MPSVKQIYGLNNVNTVQENCSHDICKTDACPKDGLCFTDGVCSEDNACIEDNVCYEEVCWEEICWGNVCDDAVCPAASPPTCDEHTATVTCQKTLYYDDGRPSERKFQGGLVPGTIFIPQDNIPSYDSTLYIFDKSDPSEPITITNEDFFVDYYFIHRTVFCEIWQSLSSNPEDKSEQIEILTNLLVKERYDPSLNWPPTPVGYKKDKVYYFYQNSYYNALPNFLIPAGNFQLIYCFIPSDFSAWITDITANSAQINAEFKNGSSTIHRRFIRVWLNGEQYPIDFDAHEEGGTENTFDGILENLSPNTVYTWTCVLGYRGGGGEDDKYLSDYEATGSFITLSDSKTWIYVNDTVKWQKAQPWIYVNDTLKWQKAKSHIYVNGWKPD